MSSSLPGVLGEIADAAGADAAWALARAKGGTRVYIPAEAREAHWLTELVGAEAASKICSHFRVAATGARVLIPLAKQGQQRRRLAEALRDGMSAPKAALASGMHERTVYRARARARAAGEADDRQGKLI